MRLTLLIAACYLLMLAPILTLAKQETEKVEQAGKEEKQLRKFERVGNKLVEKVRDAEKSKGTNTVYKTARTFPLMFAPRTQTDKPKAKRNP